MTAYTAAPIPYIARAPLSIQALTTDDTGSDLASSWVSWVLASDSRHRRRGVGCSCAPAEDGPLCRNSSATSAARVKWSIPPPSQLMPLPPAGAGDCHSCDVGRRIAVRAVATSAAADTRLQQPPWWQGRGRYTRFQEGEEAAPPVGAPGLVRGCFGGCTAFHFELGSCRRE